LKFGDRPFASGAAGLPERPGRSHAIKPGSLGQVLIDLREKRPPRFRDLFIAGHA
jgi:hypothetical protein